MIEGPRGTRPDERELLKACVGTVFRSSLMDEYPQLFHNGNLDNCRIILDNGRIVSHVGLTQQWASIFGCRVGVGCIGGVGTLKEHRGKGYATKLFDDASAKCYAEGYDFMIISGDRALYRRAGCRSVGLDYHATLETRDAARFDVGVSIVEAKPADIPKLSVVYCREPVRFIRPREMFERAFESSVVMNRFSNFWLIYQGESLRSYAIVSKPRQDGESIRIAEYAGERVSVLGALTQIAAFYNRRRVNLHVSGHDTVMQGLLQESGVRLEPTHAAGTVQIVNFAQLMERLRPYFAEVLGEATANQLWFTATDGGYQIRYGGDVITIPDCGEAAHFIFGTREEIVADRLASGGKAGELMREVLPVPALWYGINYV